MVARTRSSSGIQAIRGQIDENPPPPPMGTSIREWFAGLALLNPELMRDIPVQARATEAVKLADELIKALAAPRVPNRETMTVPLEETELAQSWRRMTNAMQILQVKTRQERVTDPAAPRAKLPHRETAEYDFTGVTHFRRAGDLLAAANPNGNLPYSSYHSSTRPGSEE